MAAGLRCGRHEDGREPVLATVPSITAISRTSLLTGALKTGDQAAREAGLRRLLGQAEVRALPQGQISLPIPAIPWLAGSAMRSPAPTPWSGVVLNAIDDALDKGKQGPAHWASEQVTYLRPVLDEARRAGRPVILTADHGHVLDSGEGRTGPRPAAPGERCRIRAAIATGGTPGPGEITVRGPRVVDGEEVVAAVDEKIHYTPRRAGYHGGASLAEVVIPVIILLPSDSLLPSGWCAYDAAGHAPAWWDAPASRCHAARGRARPRTRPSRPSRAAGAQRPLRQTGTRSSTSPKRRPRHSSRPGLRSPSAARLSPRPGWQASGRRSPGHPPRPTSPR